MDGRPMPSPMGMAPRSSMSGTMETKKYQQIAFEHRVSFFLLFRESEHFTTGYRSMSSSTGQWSAEDLVVSFRRADLASAMRRTR